MLADLSQGMHNSLQQSLIRRRQQFYQPSKIDRLMQACKREIQLVELNVVDQKRHKMRTQCCFSLGKKAVIELEREQRLRQLSQIKLQEVTQHGCIELPEVQCFA